MQKDSKITFCWRCFRTRRYAKRQFPNDGVRRVVSVAEQVFLYLTWWKTHRGLVSHDEACKIIRQAYVSKMMNACTYFQDSPVNLNSLAKDISQHILNREYYETRHGYEEDDALIGLLNLGTAVFKHNPPYKMIPDAHVSYFS